MAKIPDYWEGTKAQFDRVDSLRYYERLGDTTLTMTEKYKKGWLEGEALKKWKKIP